MGVVRGGSETPKFELRTPKLVLRFNFEPGSEFGGGAGVVVVGSFVRSRLYGVSAVDPVALGGATLLLLITMTVASLAPARRAARVDPIQVLRTE